MSINQPSTGDTAALVVPSRQPWEYVSPARRLAERGMATAEYAVGILAAVALALVLLRIFTDNQFFAELLKQVLAILDQLGGMLP